MKEQDKKKSTYKVKIDCALYKKSFELKDLGKLFFLYSILYLGNSILELDRTIVEMWLHKFPKNIFSSLILISFLIFAVYKKVQNWKEGLRPTIISLCTFLSTITLYLIWSRTNNNFEFYSLFTFTKSWIYFSDIFIFTIALMLLDFQSFSPALDSQGNTNGLIYDNPSVLSKEDLIQNGNYAAHLANIIEKTSGKGSFTIGVFGPWGSGKTDFLFRLKGLIEKKDESIVIEFNPWRSSIGGSESIIKDFFQTLGKKLSKYNSSISPKLKSYSKKILGSSKDMSFLITELSLSEFTKETTINQEFSELKNIINSTGKRIIIFIDDLDRMSGDEIVSILTLVRNVAYFDNTFFILTIDYEYVVNSIQLTNKFAKPSQYLDKIFQLTIYIPKIKKNDFFFFLVNLLKQSIGSSLNEGDFQMLSASIKNLSNDWSDIGILESLLDNYRDIKRFCNSITINHQVLKDEIYLQDFILLELIKTSSGLVYELIGSKRIIKNSERGYRLSEDAIKYLERIVHIDDRKFEPIKVVLNLLFTEADYNIPRKISHPETFHLYFSYHLYNLISYKEFQKLYEKDSKEISKQFNSWLSEGKGDDLETFLNTLPGFSNSDVFDKFIRASILNEKTERFLDRASKWILSKESESLFKANKEYKVYIENLFKDGSLPIYNLGYVASELLKYALSNKRDFVLDKQKLKDIIYALFDEFLGGKVGYDIAVQDFYLLNIDNTDNYQINLTKKAHRRLKEYLLCNDKNIDDFLLVLIRPRETPLSNRSNFTFNPFMRDIFDDWGKFKDIITTHKFSDSKFEFLRTIILNNIETDIFPIQEPLRGKFINHCVNSPKDRSFKSCQMR
ncbi:MAG: P-loop NTPase fold protein [Agriterribacter sp.]